MEISRQSLESACLGSAACILLNMMAIDSITSTTGHTPHLSRPYPPSPNPQLFPPPLRNLPGLNAFGKIVAVIVGFVVPPWSCTWCSGLPNTAIRSFHGTTHVVRAISSLHERVDSTLIHLGTSPDFECTCGIPTPRFPIPYMFHFDPPFFGKAIPTLKRTLLILISFLLMFLCMKPH